MAGLLVGSVGGMAVKIVCKQGEKGAWWWMARDATDRTMFTSTTPGFATKLMAERDAMRRLANMALEVRPRRWFEFSSDNARREAAARVRAMVEFLPHPNFKDEDAG